MTRGRRVRIVHYGHTVSVEPPCQHVLGRELRTRSVAVEDHAVYGVKASKQSSPLCLLSADRQAAYYPAALLGLIQTALEKAGYRLRGGQVEHGDYCFRELPPPRLANQPGLDAAIRLVGRCLRGRIQVKDFSIISRVIASIARAYPDIGIAVVGQGRGPETILRALPDSLGAEVGDARRTVERGRRVVIGTVLDMADPEVRLEQRDLLIFLNAKQILQAQAQHLLRKPDCNYRVFGFSTLGDSFAQSEWDWLTAWYGLHAVTVLSTNSLLRRVCVAWFVAPDWLPLPAETSIIEARRSGVWGNIDRNAFIVSKAAAIAEGSWSDSDFEAPGIGAAVEQGHPLRVAVLTENTEHACRLAGQLPDWRVALAKLTDRQRELASRWELSPDRLLDATADDINRTILTFEVCKADRLANIDLLIRADATNGVPDCLARSTIESQNGQPLWIADLRDHSLSHLSGFARKREQDYQAAGWIWPPYAVAHDAAAQGGIP